MFTKLQCCQKERDSQQEGDGGDSREMEGYRVKTNSIANWIFIECWRGIASWNKNKPKQQNGECFGSQKTENTHKKNAYSLPDISSRFVFCNFCFSVLTFSFCFDIFCNFFLCFIGVLPMLAWKFCYVSLSVFFPPKSIAANSIFPGKPKSGESFLLLHHTLLLFIWIQPTAAAAPPHRHSFHSTAWIFYMCVKKLRVRKSNMQGSS